MKVLIVPSWYSSDEKPTLGSFFREQAEAVAACGAEIRVAYCELRHPIRKIKDVLLRKRTGLVLSHEGAIPTYRFIRYNPPPRTPESMDSRYAEGLQLILKRMLVEGWLPDVIHLQSFYPAGLGALKISEQYGIPFVLTEHSTGFSRGDWSPYQENNLRNILAKASAIVTVSRGLKNDLASYTDKEISIIPNLVDFSKFQISNQFEPPQDKFVFFSLGYLTHKKGVDILIEGFAHAFSGRTDIVLRIGGDGMERSALMKQIKELGIETQVYLLGHLSREQVVQEMNACHSFVLASRFETFGVVFIEALSAGKPIIVPNIDGPNDIVNSNNGLLFERENIIDLSETMKKMVENYDKYDSDDIRNSCYKKYDRTVVGRMIHNTLFNTFRDKRYR